MTLLTVEALEDATLVRLWHRCGLGEDRHLSKPVNVSLARILPGKVFRSASLLSLTANQGYEEMRRKRKKWKTRGGNESSSQPDRSRRVVGMVVEMRPMDVLTFKLK